MLTALLAFFRTPKKELQMPTPPPVPPFVPLDNSGMVLLVYALFFATGVIVLGLTGLLKWSRHRSTPDDMTTSGVPTPRTNRMKRTGDLRTSWDNTFRATHLNHQQIARAFEPRNL